MSNNNPIELLINEAIITALRQQGYQIVKTPGGFHRPGISKKDAVSRRIDHVINLRNKRIATKK